MHAFGTILDVMLSVLFVYERRRVDELSGGYTYGDFKCALTPSSLNNRRDGGHSKQSHMLVQSSRFATGFDFPTGW